MPFSCPKDPSHISTDPDYCSECGAKMGGMVSTPSPTVTASSICPDCGTPRVGSAKFCEVCRYNFETSVSTNPAPAPAPSPIPAPSPVPAPYPTISPVIPNFSTRKLNVVVKVDPSLYTDPDPSLPCPVGLADQIFPLDLPENLVGRRSGSRGIYPEVSLNDPGVSHRHAKLLLEGDSAYLLELGSTNGTRVNGNDLTPGVKTELHQGDSITLGCWTRLELQDR